MAEAETLLKQRAKLGVVTATWEKRPRVTRDDLVAALDRQGVQLQEGDVALIRTGRIKVYEDAAAYMADPSTRNRAIRE